MIRLWIRLAAVVVMLAFAAAAAAKDKSSEDVDSAVARAWFNLLYDVVKDESLSPPVAARLYGYVAVALYESVAPGSHEYRSLAGQLNELQGVPQPRHHPKLHWPSVANTALARIARALLPTASATSMARINTLEAHFEREARDENLRPVINRSVEYGEAVADAIAIWAFTDGIATYNNCRFTPPVGPQFWVPTPPSFTANPLQPCWGQLRRMVLRSAASCAPPPPPPFSTTPGSDFYNEGLDVYTTVNSLTLEQRVIAQYWADGPTATGTPAGHWIAITSQLARARRRGAVRRATRPVASRGSPPCGGSYGRRGHPR